jgi:ribosomal-protein-alanine N-acetyltransferase
MDHLFLNSDVKVRLATGADVERIIEIAGNSRTAAHWTAERYREIFSGSDRTRIAIVVADESGVQGFLIARPVDKECEIENIAISAQRQRRGFGSMLLEKIFEIAKKQSFQSLFLEVRESNYPARRFYEKAGFAVIGARKGYYRDPVEDAAVYRRANGMSS